MKSVLNYLHQFFIEKSIALPEKVFKIDSTHGPAFNTQTVLQEVSLEINSQ